MDVKKLPFVSIIIPAYNEQSRIARCLDSILKTRYPKDRYEIMVVDDGSTDDTARIVKKYPVRLIKKPNGGVGSARNAGILNAKGEIIAFPEADTIVEPDWLIELVKHFDSGKKIMSVGGQNITPEDSSEFGKLVGKVYSSFLGGGGTRHAKIGGRVSETYHNPGCNVAFRREIFDIVGLYNESFRYGGEDRDIDARIREHGYKVLYNPESVVYHYRKDTMAKFLKQSYLYGLVIGRTTRMHRNLFNPFLFIPSIAVVCFPIALLIALFYPLVTYAIIIALIVYLLVCFLSALKQTSGAKNVLTMVVMYIGHHAYFGVGFLRGIVK